MAVRPFDVAGTLAVVGWIVVTGLFVYRTECGSTASKQTLQTDALALEEGESWMLLRRQDDEIGYLHRTHTRLEEGWLIEYDMLVVLELLGQTLPIEATVKSTVDRKGYVSNVQAEVDAAGRRFEARGQIDEKTATLIVDAGDGEPMQRTLDFEQRPRLASNSVHQLIARDDLEPGDTFEETYFDPTSMGRQSILMTYKGRKSIEVFDRRTEAHFIRQEVAGRELDVYVDDRGRILVQEFPMKVVGARVRPELGKTRASALRDRAESIRNKRNRNGGGLGRSLGMALDVIGFGGGSSGSLVPTLGAGTGTETETSPASPDAGRAGSPPDTGSPDAAGRRTETTP